MIANPLKVVIADNDKIICNSMYTLISSIGNIEVTGTATSGTALKKLIKKSSPDAIFVDIQMPELDGLSVVRQIKQEYPRLFVIFVSAYTQYAVEAFNLEATDYLVKPIDPGRLGKALDKVKRLKELLNAKTKHQSTNHKIWPDSDRHNQFILRYRHGIVLVDPSTILFIEKIGKKSIVHTTRGPYETNDSLVSLEKRLTPSTFFRCHKSFIINVRQVEKIVPYADRAYEVHFYNYSHKVTMRRNKFEQFCQLIGGEL